MELRERLRLATDVGGAGRRPARGTRRRPALPGLLRLDTRLGDVYLVDKRWPLDHRHGNVALEEALDPEGAALARLAPGLTADRLGGTAFVDVETTGLSGGTGTYCFLVGVGAFQDGSFRLRQFFLADPSGEPAMLSALGEVLAASDTLVTFNGRRFDLPLLETRFALNRQAGPTFDTHLDLLYPSRRLYQRRLPSCRLGALEERVLGFTRDEDVPGWLVPSLYIEYSHTGLAAPLEGVFRHNAWDILSLAALLGRLGRLAAGPPHADGEDRIALACWDEREGRLEDAARMYEAALEAADGPGVCDAARQRLAPLYRRLGRIEDASRLWRETAEGDGPAAQRIEALVELAKVREHRHRDFEAAQNYTRRALSVLEVTTLRRELPARPHLTREALEHRLGRVRRRLRARGRGGRRSTRPPPSRNGRPALPSSSTAR